MSLKDKLSRFRKELALEKREEKPEIQPKASPSEEKWAALGARPFDFEGQRAWVRTVTYPLDAHHGRYAFGELTGAVGAWQANESHPLSSAGLAPEDLLFFDTETTGLGGGAGNTIFLIGCGRVQVDRVVVTQYFLPSPADEVALYQVFLSEVKDLKHLVTYNGKAFDWPQVKTRHTFLRDAVPKLPPFGHFDLLHASRRLWRHTLESTRLAVVEDEILQFQRVGDTPGHLVPIYYFEYVKQQDPNIVKGVLEHNEYDILSLITLYIHLTRVILSPKEATARERYEVGRWYLYLGQWEEAAQCFLDVAGRDSRVAVLAQKQLATIYKKQQNYAEAMMIWERLTETGKIDDSDVWIEMAKVYEHQQKDFEKALHCAKAARSIKKGRDRFIKAAGACNDVDAIVKRIARLEKKIDSL
ncbi:MAG TPA: ribonuclease H-like domain-containing protein [Bacillales bacterium]|nr:ribonuclease H-like domain-containing protein [Bacillales bacterium]